jgi:hypothetical protein
LSAQHWHNTIYPFASLQSGFVGCRCCLCALKHHNARNAAEILSSLRSSDALARDYYKLKDALALLDESPSPALTGNASRIDRGLTAAMCAASTGGKAVARAKAAARELLLDRVCEEARREVAAAAVQVVDAVEQEVLHRKIRWATLQGVQGIATCAKQRWSALLAQPMMLNCPCH